MFYLGEKQELEVVKKVEFGVYLSDPESHNKEEKVLLPAKQVPENIEIGQRIMVFLYKDSKDRIIATTKEPLLHMDEVKLLKVAQVSKLGAFLEWGLEKDLFLPFKEQTKRVEPGEECLVALYIDKSSRLCATMKVYHYLEWENSHKQGEKVEGLVYEISEEFGAFVAVDYKYSGLIARKEFYGDVKVGDKITARVLKVKEDGRLDLSIREKAHLQMGIDAERVVAVIESFDGALPFNDKATPEVIKREMNMSKNEFKRAVGNLLKADRIEITEKSIRLK